MVTAFVNAVVIFQSGEVGKMRHIGPLRTAFKEAVRSGKIVYIGSKQIGDRQDIYPFDVAIYNSHIKRIYILTITDLFRTNVNNLT